MQSETIENPNPKKSREEEILELAKKELLREIKCASMRAEQFGAHSWAKPQKYVPSKRFLKHMIVNDSRYNDRREQRYHERREDNRRSRHSSSYVRHMEDKRDRSRRNDKKTGLSPNCEYRRDREDDFYSVNKNRYRDNMQRKKSPLKISGKGIILNEEWDIDGSKEILHSEKRKKSRKSISKIYSSERDDERRASSDMEDKERQDKLFKKKIHSKRKNSSSQLDDELTASDDKSRKLMSSEEESISYQEKRRKKHSKKKKRKHT